MSTEKLSSGRDLMTIELRCRDMRIAALEAKNAELLAALKALSDVAKGCEKLASRYSGCIDSVYEHGGDDHEDPTCAIFHRLYYANFDAAAAIDRSSK